MDNFHIESLALKILDIKKKKQMKPTGNLNMLFKKAGMKWIPNLTMS